MRILTGKLLNKDNHNINVILYNEEELKDYIFTNIFDLEDMDFCLDYYLQSYLSKDKVFISFSILLYT